jgi:hypothetical protein
MIDAHKASPSDWGMSAIKFVKYTSLLTIEKGTSYDTFHTKVGSYDTRLHSLDTSVFSGLVSGGLYDVVGLDFGYNSGNGYQNVLVTSLTKKDVTLTGLTISGAGSVIVGDKISLSVTATPEGGDISVTWASSDTASATVDASGVVTGVAASAAVTITATSTVNTSITATKTIVVKEVDPVALPAEGLELTTVALKASSATDAGWNAVTTAYPASPITTTISGISVSGSVNANVMFATSAPYNKATTELADDLMQIKKNTGVAFQFGAPFVSATSVTIEYYNTYATETAAYLPTVQVAGTAVTMTSPAATSGKYAGVSFKTGLSYTSYGKTYTDVTLYKYTLVYDASSLAKQKLTIVAPVSGAAYVGSILIK